MTLLRQAAVCAALAFPCAVAAQDKFPGVILRLPTSTRMLAMGNAGVAGRDDDVLFYGPAQLVTARGTSISYESFSSGASTGAVSSVIRFNTGGIAIGAATSTFEASLGPLIDRADMVEGGSWGTSTTFAAGIAQVLFRTRVGVTAKYLQEQIGGSRISGSAFDVGVGRDFFNYTFALSVQNIGPEIGRVPAAPQGDQDRLLPLRASFGASRGIPAGAFDVFAAGAVSWRRGDFVAPAGGLEVGYSWLEGYSVVARVGARRPERGEGALTGGAGYNKDRLSVDYAIESLGGGRVGHRFGLRIR